MARGRRTRRSQQHRQDALAQYGYPSERALRREAKQIAGASAPTVRSIERPYNRQLQSARDFLSAVQAALGETSTGVNAAYDNALTQQQAVGSAATQRLSALGLGEFGAGTQAVAGATGDSAASQLISNAASARNYAAQLPAIASGNATVISEGLRKNLQDDLRQRREQVRQSYFPALSQVRGEALQRASFNQATDQFQQNMAFQQQQFAESVAEADRAYGLQLAQFNEGRREFNIGRQDAQLGNAMNRAEFGAQYGYDPITGKKVKQSPRWSSGASGTSGAGSASALGGYSASDLRQYAKVAAPLLAPTRTSNAKDANGVQQKVTQHTATAPMRGMAFGDFVGQLTDAGLPQQLALYYATRTYAAYQNPMYAVTVMRNFASMDGAGKPPPEVIAQMVKNSRYAYQSYFDYLSSVTSHVTNNPQKRRQRYGPH